MGEADMPLSLVIIIILALIIVIVNVLAKGAPKDPNADDDEDWWDRQY